jgi:hypothetical protein
MPGETGAVTGDPGITSAVKTKLLADPDVSGLRIDVDTREGAVTLTRRDASREDRGGPERAGDRKRKERRRPADDQRSVAGTTGRTGVGLAAVLLSKDIPGISLE